MNDELDYADGELCQAFIERTGATIDNDAMTAALLKTDTETFCIRSCKTDLGNKLQSAGQDFDDYCTEHDLTIADYEDIGYTIEQMTSSNLFLEYSTYLGEQAAELEQCKAEYLAECRAEQAAEDRVSWRESV